MLNSSSRARCQDCPLHRKVGTVLHCWGLSAGPLASGSTKYSKDIVRKPTKKTIHQRVTVQTTSCDLRNSVYNHVLMLLNIMNTYLYKCLITF